MAEIWFYHLERTSAEQELQGLLRRGLQRGIPMAVITTSDDGVKQLSQNLWGHEDIGFLPHGFAGEPNPQDQPIFLSARDDAPNAARFWFYIHGASPALVDDKERTSILFNGGDESAKSNARDMWRRFKSEGHVIRYWKQDENGRWQDQAAG